MDLHWTHQRVSRVSRILVWVFFTLSGVFAAVSCSFIPSRIHAIELAVAEGHSRTVINAWPALFCSIVLKKEQLYCLTAGTSIFLHLKSWAALSSSLC